MSASCQKLKKVLSGVTWDTAGESLFATPASRRRVVSTGEIVTRPGTINAAALIGNRLPAPGETVHGIMAADFAMVDLVPAVINLARRPAQWVGVLTLGWNISTVETLSELLRSRQVVACDVIASRYFSGADKAAYEEGAAILKAAGARVATLRSHMKAVIADFGEQKVSALGSANFRSAKCLENLCITGNPEVFQLFRDAIKAMIENPQAYE